MAVWKADKLAEIKPALTLSDGAGEYRWWLDGPQGE
jgi:hypothetical protein